MASAGEATWTIGNGAARAAPLLSKAFCMEYKHQGALS